MHWVRSWQMSTIQLDFNMPDRFDLGVPAAGGSRQRPVLIPPRAVVPIERFFGILTEHYAGAFPAWLAPVSGGRHSVATAMWVVSGRRCRSIKITCYPG